MKISTSKVNSADGATHGHEAGAKDPLPEPVLQGEEVEIKPGNARGI